MLRQLCSVLHWRKMKFRVTLTFLMLCSVKFAKGLFENCDENRMIGGGEGIYLNSPNYPQSTYYPGSSCRYTITTLNSYSISMSCQINLQNCLNDQFFVLSDGSQNLGLSETHCGYNNVTTSSLVNSITFGHVSRSSNSAGYYSCYLKSNMRQQCSCGWNINVKFFQI